jgi:hypothetical protein
MDTVKPRQPNGDNAVQGILLDLDSMEPVAGKVVITENEQDALEEKVDD